MNDSNDLDGLCAIVITYHPDAACAARIPTLSSRIIVVDNGSTVGELGALRGRADDDRVELIANGRNLGIATALNQGVERAIERGFRWALLLDQDTDISMTAIMSLLRMAGAYPSPETLAMVGARFDDPIQRMSATVRASDPNLPWDEVANVITSGSLLSLAAYRRIGRFRDEFFIDYVDEEYCLRARRLGFHILRTKAVLIGHAVGAPREGRFLWLRKWTTNHSADRRFYIARNDTILLRESGRHSRGRWAWKSAQRRLQMCKRILLFEDEKLPKVAATVQGWWAGVLRRMGPRHGP